MQVYRTLLPRTDVSTYRISSVGAVDRRQGTYNSYVLLLVLALPLCVSSTAGLVLFGILFFSLFGSLAVGGGLQEHGSLLSWRVLPAQLMEYSALVQCVFSDLAGFFLGSLMLYSVFHRVVASWDAYVFPFSGRILFAVRGQHMYGAYLVLRSCYLVRALLRPPSWTSRRRLVWAYLLGNVGLAVRCFKYDLARRFCGWLLVADASLDPERLVSQLLFGGVGGLWLILQMLCHVPDNVVFYRLHRSVHSSSALYSFCHAVHHQASHPSLLDSGTIAPSELLLTDATMPGLLLLAPAFMVMGYEAACLVGHFSGHSSELLQRTAGRHHRLHHQQPQVNFGLQPHYDLQFGTAVTQ